MECFFYNARALFPTLEGAPEQAILKLTVFSIDVDGGSHSAV
jgi:hypothetical protein